ncbi:long-chain fatty acid--CoA ligase [Candidatus Accumulibacter phosphatis]|uniref:Long-chain fatty acid--CoA ligase n=1 Tax=Candidatus Accumulibacter phosphatis TaxID=327160 RepID=A0ABX1U2B6_9PROT|nr:AMP-binding protein [Candidatus Accumulibacter phosphatis]NMQ29469.1 long-chain fatty acid--CoA ligase [Candidatus Accumulibacter phosphatis]
MNLAHLLARTARVFPQLNAVTRGEQELWSYAELFRRAAVIAGKLRGVYGLQAGDRVALFMANCPQYLELLYGVWHAGLVAVPINNKLHPREVAFICENSAASLLFVAGTLGGLAGAGGLVGDAGAVAGRAPGLRMLSIDTPEYRRIADGATIDIVPRAPDDLAWLFYTSGTTGQPKGVMLSQRNLLAMSLCYFTDVDQATRADSILYAAPMSHGAGMYNFAHVLVGARHVVPASGGFDVAEILALAQHFGQVSLFAAPTMVLRLVEHVATHGSDCRGIKTIVYGGGPMYLEDIRRALDVLGDRLVQIYGQGESPMTITALARQHLADREHPRYLERIVSVGVAQSVVEVVVADADGQPLPAGVAGEVLVRGETVMQGYWRNPEASAATLRDGWLYTGDVGVLDDDGFLTLKDRSKDVIISGGSNIYPREVEEVLLQHAAVAEVSVIGRPSAEWGEEVVAFVVCRAGLVAPPAELDQLCLQSIARFKRPKNYVFVAALPKNNYGKVLKTELRRHWTS